MKKVFAIALFALMTVSFVSCELESTNEETEIFSPDKDKDESIGKD